MRRFTRTVPIGKFQANQRAYRDMIGEGMTLILTADGKPFAVVMRPDLYEKLGKEETT